MNYCLYEHYLLWVSLDNVKGFYSGRHDQNQNLKIVCVFYRCFRHQGDNLSLYAPASPCLAIIVLCINNRAMFWASKFGFTHLKVSLLDILSGSS